MGVTIDAWHGLPIEAVCVWLAVSYTTVIFYEVMKIRQAIGRRAPENPDMRRKRGPWHL